MQFKFILCNLNSFYAIVKFDFENENLFFAHVKLKFTSDVKINFKDMIYISRFIYTYYKSYF